MTGTLRSDRRVIERGRGAPPGKTHCLGPDTGSDLVSMNRRGSFVQKGSGDLRLTYDEPPLPFRSGRVWSLEW